MNKETKRLSKSLMVSHLEGSEQGFQHVLGGSTGLRGLVALECGWSAHQEFVGGAEWVLLEALDLEKMCEFARVP